MTRKTFNWEDLVRGLPRLYEGTFRGAIPGRRSHWSGRTPR